jgi:hypothetical protein
MTTGERRVRTKFNPSSSDNVDLIKQRTAELIDLVNDLPKTNADTDPDGVRAPEAGRLRALAMTAYEEAYMWAVKAATA